MKLIFGLAFLLGCLTCTGQTKRTMFGLSSSLDFNSYSSVHNGLDELLTFKGVVSYSAGVILRHELTDKIVVKSGLYYSGKSFYETIHPYNDPDDPLIISEDFKIIHASKFIDLPMDFQLHLKPERKVGVYPLVGLVNSFRIGYKLKDKDSW